MLDRDALEDSDEALSQIKRVSLLDELKEREICWYDPREPDFPAELLSRPSQSSIHSFLYLAPFFKEPSAIASILTMYKWKLR